MTQLNLKLVEIALERVSTTDFELFVNAVCPRIFGVTFIPTGGIHDGGADAYQDTGLYEGGRIGTFYQASVQEDHRAKIRHTVKRLRDFGRDPTTLIYITSRPIGTPDAEEELLSEELNVTLKIRDRRWIIGQLQDVAASRLAYDSYLAPHVSFLDQAGGASLLSESTYLKSRSVCVFLGQEVDRRRRNSELLVSVVDSLILWSLTDTNPDAGRFLTRDQILEYIEASFPPSKKFIRGVLDQRLLKLSSKANNTQGREIRWYPKERKACLPYETRILIREENLEDEYLKTTIVEEFELAAASVLDTQLEPRPSAVQVARVVISAIEQAFINNGLELAAFIAEGGSNAMCPPLSDDVDAAIAKLEIPSSQAPIVKEVALRLLRRAFYESTPRQRTYLGKLSRTYALLFSLQADAKTVDYFQHMSGEFVLFVGTDILVRALSEQYLPEKDRMTCNLLKILKSAGSTLYLCDPVLEEVHRHLETTDWEFINYCMRHEHYIDANIARHIDKILIRAYFYAKLLPAEGVRAPSGWKSFLGQFCEYNTLHQTTTGQRQLRQYFVQRFDMEVLTNDDLADIVNANDAQDLANQLVPLKKDAGKDVLAHNDARMILAVYGTRHRRKEEFKGSAYGFATWWLTQETRVQLATSDLVRRKGAKYILRPDFVLNFISLSPTMEEVRKSYEEIMPTLLGIQLSNRMREDVFHDVMRRVEEVRAVDEARARVMMGEFSNRLKGDGFKQYEASWSKSPI